MNNGNLNKRRPSAITRYRNEHNRTSQPQERQSGRRETPERRHVDNATTLLLLLLLLATTIVETSY